MNPTDQAVRTGEWLSGVLNDDDESREFTRLAADRIRSSGAEQYFDAEKHKMLFETMPVDDLFQYAEEEALDLANYAYMLWQRAESSTEQITASAAAFLAVNIWRMIRTTRVERGALEAGQRALKMAERELESGYDPLTDGFAYA